MSCYHYKKHIAIIFKEANVKERVIRSYICDFGACKHFNHFAISHSDWAWISSSKKKSSCNHRYIFSFLSPSADILKGEQRWQSKCFTVQVFSGILKGKKSWQVPMIMMLYSHIKGQENYLLFFAIWKLWLLLQQSAWTIPSFFADPIYTPFFTSGLYYLVEPALLSVCTPRTSRLHNLPRQATQ